MSTSIDGIESSLTEDDMKEYLEPLIFETLWTDNQG